MTDAGSRVAATAGTLISRARNALKVRDIAANLTAPVCHLHDWAPLSTVPSDSGMQNLRLASAHAVQFYESEEFLSSAVGNFLAEGIRAGEPVMVIATEEHRDAFIRELQRREMTWDSSRIRLLDARDTLELFMEG